MSITDYRSTLTAEASKSDEQARQAKEMAATALKTANDAEAKAAAAALEAKAPRVDLGIRSYTFNSVVSAVLGSRRLPVSVPGALVTDQIVAYRTGAWPAGYEILGPGYVSIKDIVEVGILTPTLTALQLGQVTLSFRFFALRPTT